jgi:hypothetical protein
MSWQDKAYVAIRELADTGVVFDADDLLAKVGHPDDNHVANAANNAIGTVFRRAHSAGLIQVVGTAQSRQPKRKGGLVRTWQGTEFLKEV